MLLFISPCFVAIGLVAFGLNAIGLFWHTVLGAFWIGLLDVVP